MLICLAGWYLFAWSWVFSTDNLDLANSNLVGMIIAFWVITFNTAIALFVVGRTFKLLKFKFKKTNPWLIILVGLPVFAFMDFFIVWLTAIIWIGPEGSIDNVMPFISPAMILINTPLKYAARVIGFYGLAAFFWLLIFTLSIKKYRKLSFVCGFVLALFSTVGYVAYSNTTSSNINAIIISEELKGHVGVIYNADTDLVVFPEYGLDKITDDNLQTRLAENNDKKTYFIGSQQRNLDDPNQGHFNSLIFGDNKNGISSFQDKYRLIPAGEDLSYAMKLALILSFRNETIDYFGYSKKIIKGSKQLTPIKINDNAVLGAAVCSSIISPEDYRHLTKNGSTLLSNSASLTIFKGSRVFAWQQKTLARFMAISNYRYFLQSANSAPAFMLDENGNQQVEVNGKQAKEVTVKNYKNKTIYTIMGEWLSAIGAIIVLIWGFDFIWQRWFKGKKSRVIK